MRFVILACYLVILISRIFSGCPGHSYGFQALCFIRVHLSFAVEGSLTANPFSECNAVLNIIRRHLKVAMCQIIPFRFGIARFPLPFKVSLPAHTNGFHPPNLFRRQMGSIADASIATPKGSNPFAKIEASLRDILDGDVQHTILIKVALCFLIPNSKASSDMLISQAIPSASNILHRCCKV